MKKINKRIVTVIFIAALFIVSMFALFACDRTDEPIEPEPAYFTVTLLEPSGEGIIAFSAVIGGAVVMSGSHQVAPNAGITITWVAPPRGDYEVNLYINGMRNPAAVSPFVVMVSADLAIQVIERSAFVRDCIQEEADAFIALVRGLPLPGQIILTDEADVAYAETALTKLSSPALALVSKDVLDRLTDSRSAINALILAGFQAEADAFISIVESLPAQFAVSWGDETDITYAEDALDMLSATALTLVPAAILGRLNDARTAVDALCRLELTAEHRVLANEIRALLSPFVDGRYVMEDAKPICANPVQQGTAWNHRRIEGPEHIVIDAQPTGPANFVLETNWGAIVRIFASAEQAQIYFDRRTQVFTTTVVNSNWRIADNVVFSGTPPGTQSGTPEHQRTRYVLLNFLNDGTVTAAPPRVSAFDVTRASELRAEFDRHHLYARVTESFSGHLITIQVFATTSHPSRMIHERDQLVNIRIYGSNAQAGISTVAGDAIQNLLISGNTSAASRQIVEGFLNNNPVSVRDEIFENGVEHTFATDLLEAINDEFPQLGTLTMIRRFCSIIMYGGSPLGFIVKVFTSGEIAGEYYNLGRSPSVPPNFVRRVIDNPYNNAGIVLEAPLLWFFNINNIIVSLGYADPIYFDVDVADTDLTVRLGSVQLNFGVTSVRESYVISISWDTPGFDTILVISGLPYPAFRSGSSLVITMDTVLTLQRTPVAGRMVEIPSGVGAYYEDENGQWVRLAAGEHQVPWGAVLRISWDLSAGQSGILTANGAFVMAGQGGEYTRAIYNSTRFGFVVENDQRLFDFDHARTPLLGLGTPVEADGLEAFFAQILLSGFNDHNFIHNAWIQERVMAKAQYLGTSPGSAINRLAEMIAEDYTEISLILGGGNITVMSPFESARSYSYTLTPTGTAGLYNIVTDFRIVHMLPATVMHFELNTQNNIIILVKALWANQYQIFFSLNQSAETVTHNVLIDPASDLTVTYDGDAFISGTIAVGHGAAITIAFEVKPGYRAALLNGSDVLEANFSGGSHTFNIRVWTPLTLSLEFTPENEWLIDGLVAIMVSFGAADNLSAASSSITTFDGEAIDYYRIFVSPAPIVLGVSWGIQDIRIFCSIADAVDYGEEVTLGTGWQRHFNVWYNSPAAGQETIPFAQRSINVIESFLTDGIVTAAPPRLIDEDLALVARLTAEISRHHLNGGSGTLVNAQGDIEIINVNGLFNGVSTGGARVYGSSAQAQITTFANPRFVGEGNIVISGNGNADPLYNILTAYLTGSPLSVRLDISAEGDSVNFALYQALRAHFATIDGWTVTNLNPLTHGARWFIANSLNPWAQMHVRIFSTEEDAERFYEFATITGTPFIPNRTRIGNIVINGMAVTVTNAARGQTGHQEVAEVLERI